MNKKLFFIIRIAALRTYSIYSQDRDGSKSIVLFGFIDPSSGLSDTVIQGKTLPYLPVVHSESNTAKFKKVQPIPVPFVPR
jgi:hypothetical protein